MRGRALSLVNAGFVSMLVPRIIPQSRGERAKVKVLLSEVEVQVAGGASPGVVLSSTSVSPSPEAQGTHYKKWGVGVRMNILQAQATCQGHFTWQVSQRLLLGHLEVSSSK